MWVVGGEPERVSGRESWAHLYRFKVHKELAVWKGRLALYTANMKAMGTSTCRNDADIQPAIVAKVWCNVQARTY